MGYTHYWTQTRNLTVDEWTEVTSDIREIVKYVECIAGIPLANSYGDAGTAPTFDSNTIAFNGAGDSSHETFQIHRKRLREWPGAQLGRDFCKTARKPYDLGVTACLCYLNSVSETHSVTSDGHGRDFLDGLEAARKALPRKANILDIPFQVMQEDRWTGPWIRGQDGSGYNVQFCVNGKGYVTKLKTQETYCFHSHAEMGKFLDSHKLAFCGSAGKTSFGSYGRTESNIWHAMGSFDKARYARIARAQGKVLATLFPVPAENAENPPSYVRPMDIPADRAEFCYSLEELVKKSNI